MKASISAARVLPVVSLAYGSRRALLPIYRKLMLMSGRRSGASSSSYAAAVSPYTHRRQSRVWLLRIPLAAVAAGFHAATLIPILSALQAEGGVG